jgi:TonB family protein
MEAFALYLFKSVVWLTGFALVYLLFLRNERYFLINRIYLVAGILASVIFPFITWHYTIVIPMLPSVEVSDLQTGNLPQISPIINTPEFFSAKTIALGLYLAGSLYLLYRIIKQTITVVGVIRKSEILPYRSAKLIRSDAYPSSFSFFSFVFVNPSSSEMETSEIVNHEMEHVRQRHWIDLVLFELLCTLQWLNPLCWLYGRFIRQNHEFLADQHALQRTQNPAIYRAALINQLFGGEVISLANSFNYSINKKRFHMMTNTIHPPYRKLKLLVILPMIAAVFYAFATPEYRYVELNKNSTTIQESTPAIESIPVEAQDTTKSSVTTLEGNFVAPSPMGETSPISGFRFSAKNIQGLSGKGNETVKGEDISLDLGNTTSAIFIDGKESTKAEFDKLDPNTIKSVSITKGQAAANKYGNKGKNGVIEIILLGNDLNSTSNTMKVRSGSPAIFTDKDGSAPQPLIVIDGVIAENVNINDISPETVESVRSYTGEAATKLYGDKGKNGVIQITRKIVEQMPEFPGGETALNAYIAANVKYPLIALDNGIQGTVYVSFIITKTGKVSAVKIKRGVDSSLDKEAMRVIKSMPSWIPGKQNGEAVDVSYELPINFGLPDDYNIKKGKLLVWYRTGIKPEDQAEENYPLLSIGTTGKGEQIYTLKGSDYSGIVDINIYNRNSKLLKTESKNGPTFSLSYADLPDGEYFLYARIGSRQYAGMSILKSSTVTAKSSSEKKAEAKTAVNLAATDHELTIVPNPTDDKATITLKGSDYNSKLQVSVFDKDGKLIKKDTKTGPTFNLSFANYTSGNYLIVVMAGKDQYSGHLIVNH